MRKITVLMAIILLIATNKIFAQSDKKDIASNYAHYIDSLLATRGITQKNIPSGILYDRTISFAGLQQLKHNDTITSSLFLQAATELRNASYDSTIIPTGKKIREITEDYIYRQEVVPIGILDYKFSYVDTLVAKKGLVTVDKNGKIKLDKKFTFKEILEKEILMVSVLNDEQQIYNQVRFVLAPELMLNNKNKSFTNYEIDFDDGLGFRQIFEGVPIDIDYVIKGKKVLKLKTVRSYNEVLTGTMTIDVNEATGSWGQYGNIPDGQRKNPEYAEISYNGFRGLGFLTYLYRNADKKLRKVLLVCDGIDWKNSRMDKRIFDEYLNNSESVPFAYLLYQSGYDLVILDFPKEYNKFANKTIEGGADDIQRNAFLTVRVIQKLDSVLKSNGSNEPLVIVGPSMGGLVTRYALAYMEKNGLNHNTRLWVSFDSPHNGANIPIGAQHFLNYFAEISPGAEEAREDKLKSHAAQQMVIHHYRSNSETPLGDPIYNQAWKNDLANIGYPQNLRKIAIANGSLNSTPTGNPGMRAVTMDIKVLGVTIGWGYINTTLGYNERKLVFRGILPDEFNTTSKYAKGLIDSYSLDNSPGGTRTTFADLVEPGSSNIVWDIPLETHSFIPTKSALGFTGSNKDLAENVTGRNLVSTGETPFQSYYGPVNKNMDHISFSTELAIWLNYEINGIPQPPMQEEYKLTGPNLICSLSPVTYNFSNTPSIATVNWSCSDNMVIVTKGGNSCSISPLAPINMYQAWVQAEIFINSVRVGTFKKDIRLSYTPTPPIINVPSEPVNCNYDATIWVSSNPNDVSYNWSISNGTILSQNGAEILVRANCPPDGWKRPWKMTLYVQATNNCGSSSGTRDVSVTSDGLINPTAIIISPNPSADDITLSEKVTDDNNEPWTLKLINSKGMIVLFTTESLPKTINVRDLTPGIYYLVAKRGNYSEQQTIIIK